MVGARTVFYYASVQHLETKWPLVMNGPVEYQLKTIILCYAAFHHT